MYFLYEYIDPFDGRLSRHIFEFTRVIETNDRRPKRILEGIVISSRDKDLIGLRLHFPPKEVRRANVLNA